MPSHAYKKRKLLRHAFHNSLFHFYYTYIVFLISKGLGRFSMIPPTRLVYYVIFNNHHHILFNSQETNYKKHLTLPRESLHLSIRETRLTIPSEDFKFITNWCDEGFFSIMWYNIESLILITLIMKYLLISFQNRIYVSICD